MSRFLKYVLVFAIGFFVAIVYWWAPSYEPTPHVTPEGTVKIAIPETAGRGFWFVSRQNGQLIEWVVDTGASIVSVTPATAALLGVRVRPSDYKVATQLADGSVARGAFVTIPAINVGGITIQNVDALVADSNKASNLMGWPVLRRFNINYNQDGWLILETNVDDGKSRTVTLDAPQTPSPKTPIPIMNRIPNDIVKRAEDIYGKN